MTIEDGLKAFLMARLGTDRIYSHRAPQVLPAPVKDPYIVFYRVTPNPQHTHSGPSKGIERTFQFSDFHESQSVALALADRLRRELDGYRGLMGDVLVYGCFWAFDDYNFNDLTTPQLHQINTDFRIHYTET